MAAEGPRVIADEALPDVARMFAAFGAVECRPAAAISAPLPSSAELLLLRSVTRVDDELLNGASGLRFIGSATSGIDHLDLECLARRGIAWAASPNSNAASVVDYVLTVLAQQEEDFPFGAKGRTVGIIGCGHIGGELMSRLHKLGVHCLISDPPRAAQLPTQPLSELLSAADILSFHVPLTAATHHLINRDTLAYMSPDVLLINSSRGTVLSTHALLERATAPSPPRLVLDTWEAEPAIDLRLVECARVATPHIAGHSTAARYRALCSLHRAASRHLLGQSIPEQYYAEYIAQRNDDNGALSAVPLIELSAADGADFPALLRRLSTHCCPLEDMDRQLRSALAATPTDSAAGFLAARKNPPQRIEFSELALESSALPSHIHGLLRAAGFAP